MDLDRYHLIGYLLSLNSLNINKVFAATRENKKSEAFTKLKELAFETIPEIEDIENLSYGSKSVRSLLLLFNLVTLINKGENSTVFHLIYIKRKMGY